MMWTKEQDAQLTEMAKSYPAYKIGAVFGVGEHAVWNRARRLGIKVNPNRLNRAPRRDSKAYCG